MKILFYMWSGLACEEAEQCLRSMGHHVICETRVFEEYTEKAEAYTYYNKLLEREPCDILFSFNFIPPLSLLAEKQGIKYVCWVYDSPLLTLYSDTLQKKGNYVFLFDKKEYMDLKRSGIETVYYLPLAANAERMEGMEITEADKELYQSDITFLGSLYQSNFYDDIKFLPDYLKGYLDGLMESQLLIQGYNFLEEAVSQHMPEIKKYVKFDLGEGYSVSDARVFSVLFLGQKLANLERTRILNGLAEHFSVTVYSGENKDVLHGVKKREYVDYMTVMPKVFRLSKINLNITLRNIQTGIPLRALDIMGAGGFLLSNYQEELCEYFIPGEDFVYYENMEDLIYKAGYYLEQEEERKRIAFNGHEKVKKFHNYRVRLEEILNMAGE